MSNMIEARTPTLAPREREGETTWLFFHDRDSLIAANWPSSRLGTDGIESLNLRHLVFLDLSGQYFPTELMTGKDMRQLSAEPLLERLTVHGVSISSVTLMRELAGLPSLTAINLCGLDITDGDIATLSKAVPYLNQLVLGGARPGEKRHYFDSSRLTVKAWPAVANLNHLTHLCLRDVPLEDDAVTAFPSFVARLKSLDLGDTRIGDSTLGLLGQSGVLRRLAVDGTRISDEGVKVLAGIDTLTDLDISRTHVGEVGLRQILKSPRFMRLGLAELQFSDTALSVLSEESELEEVDLSGSGVGRDALSVLVSLPRLKRLKLDRTPIQGSDVRLLVSPSLNDLSLEGVLLDPDATTSLARCSNLKRLTLQVGNDWSGLDAHVASINLTALPPKSIRLPNRLRRLHLKGTLTSELRDALAKLQELEEISISGGANLLSDLTSNAFERLGVIKAESAELDDLALNRLSMLPHLTELYISGNKLGRAVSQLRTPYLNTLELRDTLVDDKAIDTLAGLPRLHCLDLPHTNVTPGAVADLVAAAQNLQSLALDSSQITRTSVKAMADYGLLVELYLYGKAVTNDTIMTLRDLSSLRELNLIGTSITDSVVPHIVALSGLRTLRIEQGLLSDEARFALISNRPDIRLH